MEKSQPRKIQTSPKVDLLERFYEHLQEEDWLEGVDIYQAGRVAQVDTLHNLVTAKIESKSHIPAEVRLKLHPSGRVIQWIECTCKKNRTYGQYCEHIAALMIHINQEKNNFINKLDMKMPFKPPAIGRQKRKRESNEQRSIDLKGSEGAKSKGASQSILDHLKGSIQSVTLISGGPKLRVKIEIKSGQATKYELDLDESAQFLSSSPAREVLSSEVKNLHLYKTPFELGTRIYLVGEERIIAERVAAVRHSKTSVLLPPEIKHITQKHYRLDSMSADPKEGLYTFLGVKGLSRYLGKNFVFIPQRGFWPKSQSIQDDLWNELPLQKTFKEDEAARFVQSGYGDYLATGPVWLDENLKNQQIENLPKISEVKIFSEQDGWFKLDPRYGNGKDGVSMSQLMLQANKKKRKYIRSGESWLQIPDFITQHNWNLDEQDQLLKVDALGLMRLKAAIGDYDKFVGSKKMLQKMRQQIEYQPGSAVPKIGHTNLSLRSYQTDGLRWFWWLYKNNLHGLLADEMGLGKTHQAMAILSAIQESERIKNKSARAKFLVVCPTTVLDHWEDKINEFAPNLRPLKYHGPKRSYLVNALENGQDTLVTSYGILLRDIKQLCAIHWDAVILDEAHYVKNNNTATYRSACRLQSKIRLCLTGTPMENHLGELKNLFDFLVPGYLGSDEYFRKHFVNPIQNKDLETEVALQKLIYPLKLRRLKSHVLEDLPDKIEDVRHCSLSSEQVRLYRDILTHKAKPLVDQLSGDGKPIPYLHVFATLQLLKQVCNHPALLKEGSDYKNHESGKFELLKEILSEALDSGNKVVIFSQYVKMIEIIKHYCDDNDIGCVTLTGRTRQRGKVIERFQTDSRLKVFIGSLLAGGIGIDLTAASVVIHYDRWWNASKENQATDRVHRIGQKKFVQVMKMTTRGTLEEKISKMIESKNTIFKTFLEKDEELFKSMSRQDLINLLQ